MAESKRWNGSEGYAYFAAYISDWINSSDVVALNNSFKTKGIDKDPAALRSAIEEFMMEQWEKKSLPDSGNRKITRDENFRSFVRKNLTSLEQDVISVPFEKEQADFTNITSQLRSALGLSEQDIDRGAVSSRALRHTSNISHPDTISELKDSLLEAARNNYRGDKEFKEENLSKYEKSLSGLSRYELIKQWQVKDNVSVTRESREATFESLKTRLDNAEISGNYNNVLAIHEALEKMREQPIDSRKLNSIQIAQLRDQSNRFLDSRGSTANPMSYKNSSELRDALTMKGIDTKRYRDFDDLRAAAEKEGIGLRKFDLNEDELKSRLISKNPSLDIGDLDHLSRAELQEKYNRTNFKKPTNLGKSYYDFDDLPKKGNVVRRLFSSKGVEFDDSEHERLTKKIKTQNAFFTDKVAGEVANQRMSEKLLGREVYDTEVERRYMNWKYGDPDRELHFRDREQLAKLSKTAFKRHIYNKPVEPTWSEKTGKLVPDRLSKEHFIPYQDNLRRKVDAQKTILDVAISRAKKDVTKSEDAQISEFTDVNLEDY